MKKLKKDEKTLKNQTFFLIFTPFFFIFPRFFIYNDKANLWDVIFFVYVCVRSQKFFCSYPKFCFVFVRSQKKCFFMYMFVAVVATSQCYLKPNAGGLRYAFAATQSSGDGCVLLRTEDRE